jgi:DNA-directed RNA polymerase specialized sigma24 family protein
VSAQAPPEFTTEKLLVGLVALAVADREAPADATSEPRRAEVVLNSVEWTIGEIAYVTGRKYEAVKATIRRARGSGR